MKELSFSALDFEYLMNLFADMESLANLLTKKQTGAARVKAITSVCPSIFCLYQRRNED
jgi:hypothetical protein